MIEIVTTSAWRFRKPESGLYQLIREHYYDRETPAFDALGQYWFFAVATTQSGSIEFLTDRGAVVPEGKRYAIFFPVYSIVEARMLSLHQKMECLVSRLSLGPDAPRQAVLLSHAPSRIPASVTELKRLLLQVGPVQVIERCSKPSAISARIKKTIDQSYLKSVPMSALAEKLKISSTLMGRYFKRDFGISPLKYRNHMRIVASGFELLEGKPITRVFQDVGFEDLSRFNKQFRRLNDVTPSKFQPRTNRPKKSKNAKT